jgi:hypothetical protein
MNRHHCNDCDDCDEPIPNGQAHIRSVNFRQVAWCDFCHLVRIGNALIASWAA